MAASGRRVLREINRTSSGRGGQASIVDFFAARTPNTNMLPESFLTPSPDEQVIRLRGRKIIQIDSDSETETESRGNVSTTPKKNFNRTPKKSPMKRTPPKTSPIKTSSVPTRTSPRKRLHLPTEVSTYPPTPTKTPKTKRRCLTLTGSKRSNVKSSIKALSNSQLVELVFKLVERHPDLEKELSDMIPAPDLAPLEERLKYLQKNISTSFPYSRWGSRRDAFCYRRVSTHLQAFKKECIEQGRHLVATEQWVSVVEYTLNAWKYVQELPDWDNPSHNKQKQMCFKTLASQCMHGLRSNVFSTEQYEDIHERLLDAQEIDEQIGACVKYVDSILKKH